MIRTILLLTLSISLGRAQAQQQLTLATRSLLHDLQLVERLDGSARTAGLQQLARWHGLQCRGGEPWVGAVAILGPDAGTDALQDLGIRPVTQVGELITLRFPLQMLPQVAALQDIRCLETGGWAEPDLEHSRKDTRADSVQLGLAGLPQGFDGSGVVVAVIDWGFDYLHPVFRDEALEQWRLTRAWDQNKTSGPGPLGYDFGTEYAGTDALIAAGADTIYVFGPSSHGTHVAGIAAGNGAGTTHVGMAPGAELVFISLLRDDASFIDAIHYIKQHAESLGKPFVVNMSFGSHLGPHDGTGLREVAMDMLAGPGRVFVGSAGNNGNNDFHLRHGFGMGPDTLRTVVEFGGVADLWGQALPIWGSPGGQFSARLLLVDNGGEVAFQTPFFATADEPMATDTVVFAPNDTLITRIAGQADSPLNGKPNMLLEVRRTGPYKVVLEVAGSSGELHMWNVMRLANRFTNWGTTLSEDHPGAVRGDNAYGLGEPAGVGASVITCAAHRAERQVGNNLIYGQRSSFSSFGPTVDGRTKPDISAPGQSVRSSVSSFDPASATAPQFVTVDDTQFPFSTFSGTSMSAPAVTGVVALMLQANPSLDAAQVKEILRETASLDAHTGDIGPQGTLDWGWGKVNALAAVLSAAAVASVNEVTVEPDDVLLYPNPTDGFLQFEGIRPNVVRVFSVAGDLVMEAGAPGGRQVLANVDLSCLPGGTYLIELRDTQRVVFRRVVLK